MTQTTPGKVISTILKHDRKVTSYKLALLRSINDVVLSFPDLKNYHQDVAVPLQVLAYHWVAYYWPFCDPLNPVYQGPRALKNGVVTQDIDFRPALSTLRLEWEKVIKSSARPADGFFLVNEMRLSRKRTLYPQTLLDYFEQAIKIIARTIENPIRYAGPGEWSVFDHPVRFDQINNSVIPVPGTQPQEKCLVIKAELWETFREMSLWVEALCLHEWCLFSERVTQENESKATRGAVYQLLTDRPDNRRPLTWERNKVDLLLMEGKEFICPWTYLKIGQGVAYDLDHLLPLSVYPINELWNLVPADPDFNSHKKRDRLPSPTRLIQAEPHLARAYSHYQESKELGQAIKEDVAMRFSARKVNSSSAGFSQALAKAVSELISEVGQARNLVVF